MKTVLSAMFVAIVMATGFSGCATIPDDGQNDDGQATNTEQVITGVVRRAVVVGMLSSRFAGSCPGADVDSEVAQLLFQEQGLSIITLADAGCTRASALAAMRSQIAGAETGSLLVLFWSGHGGQQADTSGDESDGLDEFLCPYDQALLDDDLAAVFDTIPAGVRVFAIFDTCNAGTMARRALRVPRLVNPRTFRASMIVFAGCADGKSSFGDEQGGVFTTALIDAWKNGISYRDWFASALDKMSTGEQLPQWTEYGDVSTWADQPALK